MRMMELLRRAAATFDPSVFFEVPASQDTIAGPASPFVEPEPPWQPSKSARGFSLSSSPVDPEETRLSTRASAASGQMKKKSTTRHHAFLGRRTCPGR